MEPVNQHTTESESECSSLGGVVADYLTFFFFSCKFLSRYRYSQWDEKRSMELEYEIVHKKVKKTHAVKTTAASV